VGFQVDSDAELESIHGQLAAADRAIVTEKNASCCYARSDKYWVTDPAGVAWETFHSLGSVPVYGNDGASRAEAPKSACGCAQLPGTHVQGACCGSSAAIETKSACCA
jgi:hypothetical protein